jgi:2-polyprenyl-6-methoxyphenol hydroxylase-like FAD-dependent oxidoreductase
VASATWAPDSAGARRRRGPPTTALSRAWTLPAGAGARTAVAPFAQGWAWLAAPGDGRALLQLFVASGRGRLPPRRDLGRFYDQRLAEVAEAADWLDGAIPAGPVRARESTPQIARPLSSARALRVGDAALAIDPLSGHGVFEALGGALAAAPVVNTLLRRPDDAELAAAFYSERAEAAFLRHCRVGRDFYAQEGRWPEAPFWAQRRAWPDAEPAHRAAGSGAPEIAARGVIEDGFVVRRQVIVTPDHPRGVWQVDGVPLVPLMDAVEALVPAAADDLARLAAERMAAPPEQVATALAWLRLRGLLR